MTIIPFLKTVVNAVFRVWYTLRSDQERLQKMQHKVLHGRNWTYHTALWFWCSAVGSIPTRGPCAVFFAVVLGQVLKVYIYSLVFSIPVLPSEVQKPDIKICDFIMHSVCSCSEWHLFNIWCVSTAPKLNYSYPLSGSTLDLMSKIVGQSDGQSYPDAPY
jgi:hypothetical protein